MRYNERRLNGSVAHGRRPGMPSDIAGAVLYMAPDSATLRPRGRRGGRLRGHIVIDGGVLVRLNL
jgi:hypothetical protein